MSIHYLLDGYNVIHQMPSVLSLATLEDRRRRLIHFIECEKPQGSMNNRVTVVFDGNAEVFGAMVSSTVKVIFSQGESADEKIKEIVACAKDPKNIVVISDDRGIQYAIRALGAKAEGTRLFLDKANVPKEQKRGRPKNPGRNKEGRQKNLASGHEKVISKSEESKITAEFGKIWLDPERKRRDLA